VDLTTARGLVAFFAVHLFRVSFCDYAIDGAIAQAANRNVSHLVTRPISSIIPWVRGPLFG
jgi:hypothetical protein